MSMSATGWPVRVLRTQPPTNRAQPAPPAASSAAITARVSAARIQARTPMLSPSQPWSAAAWAHSGSGAPYSRS